MTLRVALGLLLLISVVRVDAAEGELRPNQVFEAAAPSIVVIETFDEQRNAVGQGSGVVVSPELVVTNCHVFKEAHTAVVRYQQKRTPAIFRHADVERDLCSFTAGGLKAPPAKLGKATTAKVGDHVYAIGAPRGLELTLSDGLISSLRQLLGGNVLQITAPISPGSSGGGLFDSWGQLIGITTAYLDQSQQLNFAVPVEWISELPRRHAKAERQRARNEAAVAADTAQATADEAKEYADRVERAKAALNALEAELRSIDPYSYAALRGRLVEEGKKVIAALPPEQWAEATRRTYYGLKAKDAADRWELVYEDESQRIHIDTTTLQKDGGGVIVWKRNTYNSLQIIGGFSGVNVSLERWRYNCIGRAIQSGDIILYSKSGAVIKSETHPIFQSEVAVAPGSIGEVVLEAVCD